MNKLKQNAFWVGLAAAVGLLAILFMTMVFPVFGDVEKHRRSLNTNLSGLKIASVPGEPDIKSWEDSKKGHREQYRTVTAFYTECDAKLESWLPELPPEPERGAFMTKYRDSINSTEAEIVRKGTKLGVADEEPNKWKYGFNWEEPQIADFEAISKAAGPEALKPVIRELQKRFWVRHRVANAILSPKEPIKVLRIHDFYFPRKLHPKLQSPPWEVQRPSGDHAVEYYPGWTGQGAADFKEFLLPDGLGTTFSFGFAVELPYSEVPKFIKEFLNPASDQVKSERILVTIVHSHMTVSGQNDPKATYSFQEGDTKDKAEKEAEALKKSSARPVMLTLSCQVIDFDPSRINTFEKKAELEPKK